MNGVNDWVIKSKKSVGNTEKDTKKKEKNSNIYRIIERNRHIFMNNNGF